MKNLFLIVSCFLLAIDATGQQVKKVDEKKVSPMNFFNTSKDCTIEYHFGALQGTNHSFDSVNCFGFGECYCSKSYEIIFLYKDLKTRKALGDDIVGDIFFKKQQMIDTFKDFECYSFVYPQRDPEMQDDIHEMNVDFPVDVIAYKRINKQWIYKGRIKAKSFEALSEFQFKIIYGLK